MNDPILFSIVIPTYNREKFIVDTLESVFSQTYKNYEVVVVDNCSTDNTVKAITPFIESGAIRFVQHEKNLERAHSRNTGMETARGDFLTFLDSDDFMYPDNLQDAADFIRENPEVRCFQNLYELVNRDREVIHRYKLPSLRDRLGAIVNQNFMSCIGNFIHREIYENYRFDTYRDLTGGEDWEFWLRVLADNEVGRIEKVNSGVLQHDARSINDQDLLSMERGLNYMVDKFRRDEHLADVFRNHLNRIEANSYLYLTVLANDNRLRRLALSYLWRALKTDKSTILTMRFMQNLRRSVLKY